jgi:hypothetical protein
MCRGELISLVISRTDSELLEVLADPAHPEHAERCEWLGEDCDPDDFNPETADATLAARFSRA